MNEGDKLARLMWVLGEALEHGDRAARIRGLITEPIPREVQEELERLHGKWQEHTDIIFRDKEQPVKILVQSDYDMTPEELRKHLNLRHGYRDGRSIRIEGPCSKRPTRWEIHQVFHSPSRNNDHIHEGEEQ